MTERKQCVICGKQFTVNRSQKLKKYCTSCSYDLKKLKASERYWRDKDPESISHNYCRGRLQTIYNQINQPKQQEDGKKSNSDKPKEDNKPTSDWQEV